MKRIENKPIICKARKDKKCPDYKGCVHGRTHEFTGEYYYFVLPPDNRYRGNGDRKCVNSRCVLIERAK